MDAQEPLEDAQLQEHLVRLGQRIKELREAKGWSQDTFAQMVGMNRAYPNKIENAKVDVRYTTLLRIAHALGVQVSSLLDDIY